MKEYVVEVLEMEIAACMVLIELLLEGKLEVVGVVAGTDGSRPDHYIFQGAGRKGDHPQAPDTLDELVRLWNKA
jgi:hypothetical protein